jgi:WD40 repeat protein
MVALKESTWPLFTIRGRGSAATHDGLLALSPDGATLVAQDGLSGVVAFDTRSGAIRGEAAFTNPREPAMISGLAFPANGDDVIVGLSDGSLCRWSISSGRHDPLDTMHTAGRVLVAANRDGSRLASCGSDGRVVLLDGQSASVIGESPCLPHALSAICFADDNDIVVAMPAADGRGTSVIRLSARPGRQLVCSGSAAVSAAVGQLAFTGSALVGMTSPFGDARGLASPAVDNAALPRAAPREAALGQALR